MLSAMMIQSYCLARQQADEFEWETETASWVWAHSKYFDAHIQITDDGFSFYLDDGSAEAYRTEIKNLTHLQQLITSYENGVYENQLAAA
jgi:protein associated with RNAse G/E